MNRIFEAYIYRPNSPDDLSGVSVKLPATPYEILDSLEKAHLIITDGDITFEEPDASRTAAHAVASKQPTAQAHL